MSRRHRQLTYYAPAPAAEEAPATGPAVRRDPMHGWTLAGIHQVAIHAVNSSAQWLGMDRRDLYEAAWHAICVCLLEAGQPPERYDLVRAGMKAVSLLVRGEIHHAGYYRGDAKHGPGSGPQFLKFWNACLVTPSPEGRVIDRLAVEQIWPRLTPRQRECFTALAAWEDYATAAEAVGIRADCFEQTISQGRRRFLKLWHEHEKPSRQWRKDKRVKVRPPVPACAEEAA